MIVHSINTGFLWQIKKRLRIIMIKRFFKMSVNMKRLEIRNLTGPISKQVKDILIVLQ